MWRTGFESRKHPTFCRLTDKPTVYEAVIGGTYPPGKTKFSFNLGSTMIILETPRLFMRQFIPEDAPDMFDLNNDTEVMKHVSDVPFKTVEDARDLIRNYDQYYKYGLGRLTILVKEQNTFIGWCGLKYLQETGEIDLGYRLKKEFWNKGYATEACKACIEFGFKKPEINTIVGRTSKENPASIQVLEKAGMKYVKDFIYEGRPSVYYSIEKNT